MAGKPIATQGSTHVCSMVTGYVPHVGGPVVSPCAPNVLINGKPAALMGDMCVCVGPPDMIAQGEPTVLINGTPVATQGSITVHGGIITSGEPTVMVSTATPGAKVTMPLKRIPFPKINTLQKFKASVVGKSEDLKVAEQNIKEVKEAKEKEMLQKGYVTRFDVSL